MRLGSLSDWEANFGTVPGAVASSTAVPEPSSLVLLLGGIGVLRIRLAANPSCW